TLSIFGKLDAAAAAAAVAGRSSKQANRLFPYPHVDSLSNEGAAQGSAIQNTLPPKTLQNITQISVGNFSPSFFRLTATNLPH
ncbi:hypothetical protein IFR05_012506, partial [Cadophora sp. M221]